MHDVHLQPGHETSDAEVRPIILAGVVLLVIVVLSAGLVFGIFRFLTDYQTKSDPNPMAASGPQYPPEPRITPDPTHEYEDLRRQTDHALSTYGWVDRKQGVVRIPIDRAMELQLQRGFPVRKPESKP